MDKLIIFLFGLVSIHAFTPYLAHGHSWMAPKVEAQKVNPYPATETSIESGKVLFAEMCAYCHGDQGTGLSKEITDLKSDTPNLPERLKTHTDGDFHWKIRTGKGEMPSFDDAFTEDEIWHIINYIKSDK